jgi:hypothetical protein
MTPPKLDKVLFLGTGGGNDIFSTLLAAMSLKRLGWTWSEAAIAGVLSPFHQHTGIKVDPDILEITPQSARHLLGGPNAGQEIGFVDAVMASWAAQSNNLNITKVLGFSLLHGSGGLTAALRGLSKQYGYVVLVDLGGDIFYRSWRDRHVLSPMFDAVVLKAFQDSGIDGVLFEAGPGTDGELEPEALTDVLRELDAQRYPLDSEVLQCWGSLYEGSVKPIRPGRTVPMLLKAVASDRLYLEEQYRCRAHLGDFRLYHEFTQRISTLLCQNFYLLDPHKCENSFAVRCTGPLDWFVQTQLKCPTNNEANLEYLWHQGQVWQFATPSPLFNQQLRYDLLVRCLCGWQAGECEGLWLLPTDMDLLRKAGHGFADEAEPYDGLVQLRK